MSRPVAGLACRIRIPIRQYDAVALVVSSVDSVVRLMHRDAGLSLDVEAFDNLADAEDYHDRLSGFLDLPQVTVAASPKRAPSDAPEPPQDRRIGPARARRPRFLTRRRTGKHTSDRIAGREIIARN